MRHRLLRRVCYLVIYGLVTILWIRFGTFDAIEVPYVGF